MFCWGTQFELHRAFCFSLNGLLCDVNEDLRKDLLEEILLGGNFGQYNQENQSNGKSFVKLMKGHLRRSIRLERFNIAGVLFATINKIHTLL